MGYVSWQGWGCGGPGGSSGTGYKNRLGLGMAGCGGRCAIGGSGAQVACGRGASSPQHGGLGLGFRPDWDGRSDETDYSSAEWASLATCHFESLLEPILAREQPVTAQIATILRILAFCLAAEADALHDPDLGDGFRKIAGAITLLELRNNGNDQPVDTVVLALN